MIWGDSPWRRHGPLLLVLTLAAASLGRAVGFPFVNWDDAVHLLQNPLVADPFGQGWRQLLLTPRQGYPMPVVVLSWSLERALFGFDPRVFHLVNLLLHLANVILAYSLFLRLRAAASTAARACVILALHPLVVEPVCWVTGRKDLLAAALLLGALLVATGADEETGPPAGRLIAAQLLGALACLAKPSAIVAPVLLLLVCRQRYPAARLRRLLTIVSPLGLVAASIAVVGVRGEQALGVLPPRDAARAFADVVGAYTIQTQHFLWPRDLLAAYFRSPGDPSLLSMIIATAALVALGLLASRRAPSRSLARLGLTFALVAYLPAANVLGIARWVADSYVYLPLVGLSLGLVALGEGIWSWGSRVAQPGWIALSLALALLAFVQADVWSSSADLWRPVVERYPKNPIPLARLAMGQLHDGDAVSAAKTFLEHRRRFPDYDEIICDQAWAAARLGRGRLAMELLMRGVAQKRPDCIRRYNRARFQVKH